MRAETQWNNPVPSFTVTYTGIPTCSECEKPMADGVMHFKWEEVYQDGCFVGVPFSFGPRGPFCANCIR